MTPETASHRPFEVAPAEESLAGYTSQGRRRWIDPVVTRGRFWRIRLVLAIAGIAFFLAAPHLRLGGHPLVFLDVANRRFHLLGATFHPTDNLLLVALGLLVVLTLFTVTALWGRVWCGYGCPQTVFLEFAFRPLESLFEGSAEDRRIRRAEPPSTALRARRVAKWAVYLALSSAVAHTLVAWFVGWEGLVAALGAGPAVSPGTFVVTSVITGFLFVDMAFLRENVCAMACPYGRLQTVLYDPDTWIVGYDAKRGEPRGPARFPGRGDCIGCWRCVRTCPAGIDIRKGLQMECVGCAQCVDACDAVQARMKKPPGLVGYTSQHRLEGGRTAWLRRRVVAYGALWSGALAALLALLVTRAPAELDVLRADREPFRILPSGEVSTALRFRLTNLVDRDQTFRVELVEPADGHLAGTLHPVTVAPQEVENLLVSVVVPRATFSEGRAEARFRVTGDAGYSEEAPFLLLGPYR